MGQFLSGHSQWLHNLQRCKVLLNEARSWYKYVQFKVLHLSSDLECKRLNITIPLEEVITVMENKKKSWIIQFYKSKIHWLLIQTMLIGVISRSIHRHWSCRRKIQIFQAKLNSVFKLLGVQSMNKFWKDRYSVGCILKVLKNKVLNVSKDSTRIFWGVKDTSRSGFMGLF